MTGRHERLSAWHRPGKAGHPGSRRNPAQQRSTGPGQGGDQGDGELQEIMHGPAWCAYQSDVFFGGPTKIRPSAGHKVTGPQSRCGEITAHRDEAKRSGPNGRTPSRQPRVRARGPSRRRVKTTGRRGGAGRGVYPWTRQNRSPGMALQPGSDRAGCWLATIRP